MARTALGWGVRELATRSSVTANTVSRIENGHSANTTTIASIQSALEQGNGDIKIKFLTDNEASMTGGPGVRLKKAD